MDRRQFLKGSGAVGAVGLIGIVAHSHLTGSPPSDDRNPPRTTPTTSTAEEPTTTEETQQPVRHADEFDTVIDAVQVGADPEGNEPISDILNRNAADDTLLSFASGTYLLPQIVLTDYDHFGIAAAYDERPTFLAPANRSNDESHHARFLGVKNFLLEGIDFDFQSEGAGGSVGVIASGDATVRDVTMRGSRRSQITMFRVDIRNPEGTGLVENVAVRDNQDSTWLTGAYVGEHHSGEVTFRNCEFSEFTDNGLYGSAPGVDGGGGGTVHTEGGYFENNNVSNIRLGTSGSTARGDTIVVESAPDAERVNLRGIRFRRGADQVVENCTIRFGPSVTDSFGAIVYHADNRGAKVVNSHVTMDSDSVPAVQAFYHSGDGNSAPAFENLSVDGSASRGFTVLVNGRDGTSFRNCTIEQSGYQRDGIRLAYSDDCELIDSRIAVTGYPLILRDSTLTIRNTTLVTPDSERHIDHMEAEPGDFRPEAWTTGSQEEE